MITAPANSVLRAIEEDASVGLLLLQVFQVGFYKQKQ